MDALQEECPTVCCSSLPTDSCDVNIINGNYAASMASHGAIKVMNGNTQSVSDSVVTIDLDLPLAVLDEDYNSTTSKKQVIDKFDNQCKENSNKSVDPKLTKITQIPDKTFGEQETCDDNLSGLDDKNSQEEIIIRKRLERSAIISRPDVANQKLALSSDLKISAFNQCNPYPPPLSNENDKLILSSSNTSSFTIESRNWSNPPPIVSSLALAVQDKTVSNGPETECLTKNAKIEMGAAVSESISSMSDLDRISTNSIQMHQSTSSPHITTDSLKSNHTHNQQHSSSLPLSGNENSKNQHSAANPNAAVFSHSSSLSVSASETISAPFMSSVGDDEGEATIVALRSTMKDNVKMEVSESFNCRREDAGIGEESPVKILTKYVFINKSAKVKSNKKRLGVLYKQAFRHFQGRSKVNLRTNVGKYMTMIGKQGLLKKQDEELERSMTKKRKRKNSDAIKVPKSKRIKNERKEKKGSDKTSPTSSAQRRLMGSMPTTVKANETPPRKSQRKTKAKKPQELEHISESQTEEEQEDSRSSRKGRKKKYLNLSEKADIITQLENPLVTSSSLAKRLNIPKSSLTSILKQKDKILAELQKKEKTQKSKTTKKKRIKGNEGKNGIKEPEIKQELFSDVDVAVNNEAWSAVGDGDEKKGFAVDSITSSASNGNHKAGGRQRKELTLEEKVCIIYDLDKPGVKIIQIAKKFGVSSSAVSRIRKYKDHILSKSLSGDACLQMRRSRQCKEPALDKALLKWYRAIESLKDDPISMSHSLLHEKVKDIARAMGKSYLPSINWILRWKYRHNITCKSGRIESKDELNELDSNVDMAAIILAVEGQMLNPEALTCSVVKNENGFDAEKFIVCEHCGVMTSRGRGKRTNLHLKTCPVFSQPHRRDLTLGEKAQVARALEKPGIKKIALARKYGVSSSVISRIHKNRVNIIARCAGSYVNVGRKRYRCCSEPEVERPLVDWYRQQQEYGYHVSGPMVREKACEISRSMGKDFRPSDSWVHRWRHRNNLNSFSGFEEIEDDEEEPVEDVQEGKTPQTDIAGDVHNIDRDAPTAEDDDNSKEEGEKEKGEKDKGGSAEAQCEEKKVKIPRPVMCEKCGCVSARTKNNRVRNMKHVKGCPDLKPRNELTYDDRVKMLKALEEPGATLSSIARQFGVSASSMSRMKQKKDNILIQGIDFGKNKRIRDCKEPEVAKKLYAYFMEKQGEGIHVTGTKLKEKAASLANELGREFKASTGWLGRWKHRYNIVLRPKEDDGKNAKEDDETRSKKKHFNKNKNNPSFKDGEAVEVETPEVNHSYNLRNNDIDETNVITLIPEASQPLQATRVFLNQHYQTPWNVNHQPPPSSSATSTPHAARLTPNQGMAEENVVPYNAYDPMSRHMFHNVFESFASAAAVTTTTPYNMSMVDTSVPVRDFLQPDDNQVHQASMSVSSHHQQIIPPHQPPPPLTLHTAGISRPHHPPAPLRSQLTLQQHHSECSSSVLPVQEEEDGDAQQRQIMEACKLMNSFAKEKSLGEHVQAALRTIEMTLKGGDRKGVARNDYTNI